MAYSKKTQKMYLCTITILVIYTLVHNTLAVWLNHRSDITNNGNANGELVINPITASQRLRLRWKFFAGKDVTATPAVAAGVVYFPSWNGYLYAVNALNGGLVWKRSLNELTGLNGTGIVVNVTVSRTTPAISGDLLIVGIYGPTLVIAVSSFDGSLVWSTMLDPSPRSQITPLEPSTRGQGFYVGVSSLEVALPAEQCCTFRGSMVKLDARNGAVLWRTYTIPDNSGKRGGYAGAAIWGSSPAIDVRRRHVYVGTGQLYTAPQEVLQCQEEQNKQPGKPTHPDQCIGPDVHFNSILAFDIDSGRILWSRQLGGYDVFYFVCLVPNNPDCPPGPNLDADFGEAPMLLTVYPNGTRRDVAVAVQKSGFAWALDRDNGDIVWLKLAGPGSLEGGGVWGAATDGKRVYTNIVNADRKPFVLAPSNRTANSGGWVALDANSGRIVWTTADPSNDAAHGPVTVVNDVVFAGSVAPNDPIYAMDANTGRILWSFNTNATVYGGVSASYGCIYTGHGYTVSLAKFHPTWTPGTSIFAFCVL